MSDLLQVPCFRYFGEDLWAALRVERAGDSGGSLIRCPIRCGVYLLTPEERVRQALLWFLLNGARNTSGWRERLRFEVEHRSLDVAAFLAREMIDDRFVLDRPVLIVETKRYERELQGDAAAEEQLRSYMRRDRCRWGLMFNGREAGWLSADRQFTDGGWTRQHLDDLCEVEDRIQTATAEEAADFLESRELFVLAAAGNYDALLRLMARVGTDPRLTFVVSIRDRGHPTMVHAFGLRAECGYLITYRTRGVVSRNRAQLAKQDFHSVRALLPLRLLETVR